MESFLKKTVIFFIVLFALFGAVGILTEARITLAKISVEFFVAAVVFYLVSLFLWIISWAYLVKKHVPVSFFSLLAIGWSAIYGALTPIQLGSDALRSIKLRELVQHKMSYSQAVAPSLIVKGIKFSFIAIITSIIFFLFLFNTKMDSALFFGFLSGFTIVLLGAFLFLAPLKKKWGIGIAGFFYSYKKELGFFEKIGSFFEQYTLYLEKTDLKTFFIIIILSIFSWLFEFLALQFSFFAIGIDLPLQSFLVLMILFSALERAPFFPRGIGLVEVVGYYYLSINPLPGQFAVTTSQIGAVLIAYDMVRLVIPTVLSLIASAFFNRFAVRSNRV